jgi:hypothetical protein
MTYAIVSDVSTRLGRPISDTAEVAQVNAWLADVEAQIAARFIRAGLVLATQVTADDPSLATVVRIEADAVIRRIYQPLPGRTSQTRSVDDASITDRWDRPSTVDGWLTAADWSDLLPSVTSGAFSVRPGFDPDTPTSVPW